MSKSKTINYFFTALLSVFLSLNASVLFAQKIVASGVQSAGFRFDDSDSAAPILEYQQNIDMLSAIDDKPSLRVYGDGLVLVHNPVYMKRAGDFKLQLSDVELVSLMRGLSSNGVMTFDEKKVKAKVRAYDKKMKDKGLFYGVSDGFETVVDIKLDEYQKDKSAKKIKGFSKQFKWKNIEQDAVRHKDTVEITKANESIKRLNSLMRDKRLVHREAK